MNTKLINIRRGSINRKNREAVQHWDGVSLTGHFIGGKPVARRAWLRIDDTATKAGLSSDTVLAVLNLSVA